MMYGQQLSGIGCLAECSSESILFDGRASAMGITDCDDKLDISLDFNIFVVIVCFGTDFDINFACFLGKLIKIGAGLT